MMIGELLATVTQGLSRLRRVVGSTSVALVQALPSIALGQDSTFSSDNLPVLTRELKW